ncbi:dihydrodipicolinate synthase family protein [Cohnella fermenti]|uniref:Dihydrodipicolinate synthase family protein n=1 Tax=Cohnella fermenti TaxID=2565925 RepID=A0A4S4BXB5_9BACL|nr:dihydrodipicolinate synthase family protein [Cohnella fermenti]THF77757.1 dihydrodipicolinate synthase family protein [Cohnella fermenti]
MAAKLLHGVTTAMVTPFDEQGKVSLERVERLTDYLIERGVHCLYPLGTTGEMVKLSTEERKAVAETVVRRAAGRVTVYIHTGAVKLEDAVELSRHAADIGADGIGAVTPIFLGANALEQEFYYSRIMDSVPQDFPVYLYNIPQCSANDLTMATAESLAKRYANVAGIKYSLPDMLRTSEYLAVREGNFSVVQGTDRLFLASLAMGCDGVVSGVSCVFPEPFVAVYEAYRSGDIALARQWQRIAVKYCETLRNGSNMAYFKAALRYRGVDAGFMRLPQLDLPSDEAAELARQLRALDTECLAASVH